MRMNNYKDQDNLVTACDSERLEIACVLHSNVKSAELHTAIYIVVFRV